MVVLQEREGDAVITINSFRIGVNNWIKSHFPNARVSGEEINQIEPPAFSVLILTAAQTQELGPRYLRNHTFVIRYFAPNKTNAEIHEVAEQLYDIMDVIEVGDKKYRGTSMNHEIVDRVLHFFVDYNFHVKRDMPSDPKMEQLEQEGFIRER